MKKLSIFLIIFLISFIFAQNTEGKILPQSVKTQTVKAPTKSTTITVSPKLRVDRRALIINFANLQNAKAVSYMLRYTQASQEEAAMGNLNLTGQTSDRVELLFGTCSKNVCRYHTNIKNAKLEISYTSKSGKKYLKKFKIKI